MPFNSEVLANSLEIALTTGKDFAIEDIDFTGPDYELPDTSGDASITPITLALLTDTTVGGTGVFDKLMTATKAHLREEYDKNRITGQDYTKAYIAMIEQSMTTAVQFLLGKDQAYWQSVLAKAQAQAAAVQLVTARVQLITAKLQAHLARYEAYTAEATYSLTKLKLATEDASYGAALAQRENLVKQGSLIDEQTEQARAQTLDTRRDGAVVRGNIGSQKDLISQQITSYKRDAEVKAAKIFADAWITQKTIDEGLLAPSGFNNASLDDVLSVLKANNGLSG
ncbi:virion structural protein [Rhizobium phage RHph_Y38]|uniref:Tail protein n=2 Tax=Acanvirus TaxID=3044653 RepID=A0AAE8AWQ0_9CAUD|nr:virion structural protein [Rhizobium phage RHph_Y38]YP_010658289.1 virion structural protein [Rhizobium phage RHEph22]QIG67781.1 putative tail protein [Rhizobium phage RHph_Y38]QXV74751.1 putative tail protein [Rhizobium phage RHEph22]QXV74845.1 putative tail protein [Rhizobium phage RHEph24]